MTDGRIPGKWMNEPRFIEMNADTWTVFSKAIAWSNEAGTDGLIKWRYLSLLHPDGEQPKAHQELAEMRLWTKTPIGYQLLDWNKPAHQGGLGQATSEQVQTYKERKRRNQQEYRDRKAAEGGGDDGPNGGVTGHVTDGMTDHVGQDTTGHAQTEAKPQHELQTEDSEVSSSSEPFSSEWAWEAS